MFTKYCPGSPHCISSLLRRLSSMSFPGHVRMDRAGPLLQIKRSLFLHVGPFSSWLMLRHRPLSFINHLSSTYFVPGAVLKSTPSFLPARLNISHHMLPGPCCRTCYLVLLLSGKKKSALLPHNVPPHPLSLFL